MPRIERLTVQGFRSFGKEPQILEFDAPLAIIWGPNSEGKTSLAEAFEFLFTGDIARRQLLSSALDEFADALCNAHLPDETPTFVEATICADDETSHTLRRTVTSDFTKIRPCTSTLELDGTTATDASLAKLGIELSEPPLAAPVLMQHTLAYLFTAKPQQRSAYFKTLLEVTDLDDVRDSLRTVTETLQAPSNEHLTRLNDCQAVDIIREELIPLLAGIPSVTAIRESVASAAAILLTDAEMTPAEDTDARLAQLDEAVEDKRAETFPVAGFRRSTADLAWSPPLASVWTDLDTYVERLGEVDEETNQLIGLFNQVLALPSVKNADEGIDCPVCETPAALTPERIETIRASVAATAGFTAAEQSAKKALRTLDTSASSLLSAFDTTLPTFLSWSRAERVRRGFRTTKLAPLLEEADRPLLKPWFRATVALMRERRKLAKVVDAARTAFARLQADLSLVPGDASLRPAIDALTVAKASASLVGPIYGSAAEPLAAPLKSAIDVKSDTTGWAQLAELGRHPSELREAFVERQAYAAVKKEFTAAGKLVDSAKEAVLEDKFKDVASDVATWWELFRPGEAAFFSGLGLRKGAQRNIDFKAGLASASDRKDVKVRDAISVFSTSQVVCLGLSTFFARVATGGGFLVLDDPIVSIDDDYSIHFINSVLQELQTRGVQVIMLTFEQKTWRAIQERYDEGQSEGFQLNLDDPSQGTIALKSSDTLALLLKAAEPFTRSNVLAIRKEGCQRIRDCAERFCKELLLDKRRAQGDAAALITDYSGAKGTLDSLIPETTPYLNDAKERGELKMLRQLHNPGNHDDDVPAKTVLAMCRGSLGALKKKYL